MFEYPKILANPENPNFNLSQEEQYFLKEANELISKDHYTYSLYALWSCLMVNIQRRIEFFGMNNFLKHSNYSANYNKDGNNLKDRWLNVNEFQTVNYAKEIKIISYIAHDLITAVYWMKTNSSELSHKQEIYSISFLLEKQLFEQSFREDLRVNRANEYSQKRRKSDTYASASLQSKTHNELLLKSQVRKFEQELQNAKLRNKQK